MNSKELKAHIILLDDTDENVYQSIIDNLINEGSHIIPFLEKEWELSDNELVHKRIENIISEIQFSDTKKALFNWISFGGNDIIKGAYIVAKHRYPSLELSSIESKIEHLRNSAWLEIHDNLTALEKIRVLNHVFFSIENYKGQQNYGSDLKSTYINTVLDNKKGSPIMLSIIYLAVAQRLGIPVKGVDLINNFILAYVDGVSAKIAYPDNTNDVLFYINTFNRGSVFDYKEIDSYLEQLKIDKKDKFYNPISNIEVIRSMILELIKIADVKKKDVLKNQLKELYQITLKTSE
jgi:regulator of sirC expression with transglutaminase-like and TPR domain